MDSSGQWRFVLQHASDLVAASLAGTLDVVPSPQADKPEAEAPPSGKPDSEKSDSEKSDSEKSRALKP